MLGDRLVDCKELLEDVGQVVEVEGIGAVGFGMLRVVVDLEEDAVDACRHCRAGEHGNELGLTPRDTVLGGRRLYRVSSVEDDGGELAHDGKRAHVNDEVVVAKAGSSLGEGDAVAAAVANLFDGVAHVGGGNELTLLDVDGAAVLLGGLGGGDEEIGLAAEEGGDLEDVDGLGDAGAVLGGMDVGEDGEAVGLRDGLEDAGAFLDAGAAEAVDGGSVGLVVAGLEDVGDVEVGGDALDGVGHGAGVLLGLDDAGAGDEEESAAAYGDVADFKGMVHRFI